MLCQKQLQDGTRERPRKTQFSILSGPRETVTGGMRRPQGRVRPGSGLCQVGGEEREKGRMDRRASAFPEVLREQRVKGDLNGKSECPWSRWGEGKKATGGRASLHAGAPGHLGGMFTPCEDVQTAGKYEVLKFTVETVRFWVSFLNVSFCCCCTVQHTGYSPTRKALCLSHWTDRDVWVIFFFFLQTPKFRSYLLGSW